MSENVQKRIWDNKLKHGFNTTNVHQEFCLLYGEVAEAFDAYNKKKDSIGEELADVAIFLYSVSEMLGIDLEAEIKNKMTINEKRVYKNGIKIESEDS